MPRRTASVYAFCQDSRGVSKQIGYILAISVISLLMAGLITSTGVLVEQTTEHGTESRLQVTGDRMAAQIMAADRLMNKNDGTSELVLNVGVSTDAQKSPYRVSHDEGANELVLEHSARDVTVTIPLTVSEGRDISIESSRASDWRVYVDDDTIKLGSKEDAIA